LVGSLNLALEKGSFIGGVAAYKMIVKLEHPVDTYPLYLRLIVPHPIIRVCLILM
jgi:hypothetical protein